jgi:phage recombination protein Bet
MTTKTTEKVEAVAKREPSPLIMLGARFDIAPAKLVEVLRGTVIKPDKNGKQATNEEVAAFCIVANQYKLNPFCREIHAFTSGDKGIVPIVGIDGWTHIVNSRGDFDGCDFEEVSGEDGKPDRITCKMFVKGREHPVSATERYAECKRNSIPWQTMPWRMLRHKSYMQAARYAFGLSGIYDEDEARDIIGRATDVTAEVRMAPRRIGEPAPASATQAEPTSEPKTQSADATLPTAPPPAPEPTPAHPAAAKFADNTAIVTLTGVDEQVGTSKKGKWVRTYGKDRGVEPELE